MDKAIEIDGKEYRIIDKGKTPGVGDSSIVTYIINREREYLMLEKVEKPEPSPLEAHYVPKGSSQPAATMDGMEYVIVRTYSAGVFAGYLYSRNGQEVVLKNARRIWYWEGAASLSQLAMEGTSKPDKCKFPCAVDRVELLQAIEILSTTEKARKSIDEVEVWTA